MDKLKYELNPVGNSERKVSKCGTISWSVDVSKYTTRSGCIDHSHTDYEKKNLSFRPTLKATK